MLIKVAGASARALYEPRSRFSASDYDYLPDDVVHVIDQARRATALIAVRNVQAAAE